MHRMSRGFLLLALISAFAAGILYPATLPGSPSTTNNDDSCDISVAPAATLLLPHFEVELDGNADTARTTVFNVINVSSSPQLARVTLWTDWSYPALSFSIFLTGYDVEAVDLRDLLIRGTVPTKVGMPGPMSKPNFSNENFARTVAQDCGLRMPHVPSGVMKDVRAYLTNGRSNMYALSCQSAPGVEEHVGSDHGPNIAAGYVTIDVVATCAPTMPNSPRYFTSELLFDNVLTGDYVAIEPSGTANGYAGGSPLVHIRAIPEGGAAGSIVPTRLPYTFYDRFTTIDESTPRTIDRRQPLPATFAARWIDGGQTGFATSYSIWREARTGANAGCGEYEANGNMPVADLVRFDEHENAAVRAAGGISILSEPIGLSASSNIEPYSNLFPVLYTTDFGGWTYLNLNNGGSPRIYSASRAGFGNGRRDGSSYPRQVSQNWVVINLFAEDRYGVSHDAAWLGNGCSPAQAQTSRASSTGGKERIGPAANVNP